MIKITKENIDTETKDGVVAIFFWGSGCESCRHHFFQFITASFILDEVKFGAAHLDDTTPELLEKHKVPAVPCTVFYKDGKIVKSVLGPHKVDSIVDDIREML